MRPEEYRAALEALKNFEAKYHYESAALRRIVERTAQLMSREAPEQRFDDSLTDWDRDFLRTNRIRP